MQPEAAENTAAPQKKSRPQIRGLAVEMYAQGRVTTAGFACVCVWSVFISQTELKWQMVAVPVALIQSQMILLCYCSQLCQNNADLGVRLSGSFCMISSCRRKQKANKQKQPQLMRFQIQQ